MVAAKMRDLRCHLLLIMNSLLRYSSLCPSPSTTSIIICVIQVIVVPRAQASSVAGLTTWWIESQVWVFSGCSCILIEIMHVVMPQK